MRLNQISTHPYVFIDKDFNFEKQVQLAFDIKESSKKEKKDDKLGVIVATHLYQDLIISKIQQAF